MFVFWLAESPRPTARVNSGPQIDRPHLYWRPGYSKFCTRNLLHPCVLEAGAVCSFIDFLRACAFVSTRGSLGSPSLPRSFRSHPARPFLCLGGGGWNKHTSRSTNRRSVSAPFRDGQHPFVPCREKRQVPPGRPGGEGGVPQLAVLQREIVYRLHQNIAILVLLLLSGVAQVLILLPRTCFCDHRHECCCGFFGKLYQLSAGAFAVACSSGRPRFIQCVPRALG